MLDPFQWRNHLCFSWSPSQHESPPHLSFDFSSRWYLSLSSKPCVGFTLIASVSPIYAGGIHVNRHLLLFLLLFFLLLLICLCLGGRGLSWEPGRVQGTFSFHGTVDPGIHDSPPQLPVAAIFPFSVLRHASLNQKYHRHQWRMSFFHRVCSTYLVHVDQIALVCSDWGQDFTQHCRVLQWTHVLGLL